MRADVGIGVLEGPLSEAAAAAWIPRTCFKNGPPDHLGIEIEQLVMLADDTGPEGWGDHLPEDRYPALLADLDGRDFSGRITVEPGGQLELSSAPAPDLAEAVARTTRDLAVLRAVAASHGARLVSRSTDPARPPRRMLRTPRYDAMADFYERTAGCAVAGPAMMCSSASIQANVEAAVTDTPAGRTPLVTAEERWDLLHTVGPALVAAVANSPRLFGTDTGWHSCRQWIWDRIGPRIPPRPQHRSLGDWWADQVLDAPLMVVPRPGPDWRAPRGLTFRDWLRCGTVAIPDREPPGPDDLQYHLTTVFPPVRPRGHLEVRYLDIPPGDWWPVPVAVLAGLLGDAHGADEAQDICQGTAHQWARAGRQGLTDPQMGHAADHLLRAAAAALDRSPTTRGLAVLVDEYRDRWTSRGRCPADDGAVPAPQDHRPTRSHPNGARP